MSFVKIIQKHISLQQTIKKNPAMPKLFGTLHSFFTTPSPITKRRKSEVDKSEREEGPVQEDLDLKLIHTDSHLKSITIFTTNNQKYILKKKKKKRKKEKTIYA